MLLINLIINRGAGYVFGESAIDKFLYTNNLESILRAHQLCQEGYNVIIIT